MDEALEDLKRRLARTAVVIGHSDPPAPRLTSSMLGAVTVGLPGESWPVSKGVPMFPVAQLNLREAPYVASVVDDIALITLFFSEPVLTEEGENGGNWELRSYRDLELLIRLDVGLSRARERFPKVVWEPAVAGYSLLRSDYPDVYDIPSDLAIPELVLDQWSSRVVPCKSPKIGGWPFLLQGPLEWTVEVERQPEFAFQLTSFGNREFPFWDIAYYVGRVRGRRPSEWVLTSQST